MTHSCIYEGEVRHRRMEPQHHFRNRLFMMYLDLDELPALFDRFWLWSARSPNLAWFRNSDYIPGRSRSKTGSLADSVRQHVADQTGQRPQGPIRLLTQVRYFGFVINPISLFYCFDAREHLEFVVAEVTNTPWGERHRYILDLRRTNSGAGDFNHGSSTFQSPQTTSTRKTGSKKKLHVSPFMDMNFDYRFEFGDPDANLTVRIENHRPADCGEPPFFQASLILQRRPINHFNLARCLCRYPMMTAQIVMAIYWQAFRLWMKGARFYAHPQKHVHPTKQLTAAENQNFEKVTG